MPREARKLSSTHIYHVMIRGNRRQDIFLEDEDRLRFIGILKKKKQKGEYELYAFCLMNNHVHLLIKEKKEQLSQIMKRINISYVNYFNRKYKQVGHLFQDRFKSETIEDENYLLAVLNYIHHNPFHAFIINNLADYPWSSYDMYINRLPHPAFLIESENILSLFSPDKDRAIDLFIQYHCQNKQERSDIIELHEENKKYDRNLINEKEAKQYLQSYLSEHHLDLSNLRERKYRPDRNKLINYLKQNSNFSIRGIADLLRIGTTTVHKNRNREPSPVPVEGGI
jgi:putative transposase